MRALRSMRLSLILCFTLLLILSLAAVSGLVYQTTERNLTSSMNSMRVARLAKHEHDVQVEKANLDKELLNDARQLSNLVRFQIPQPDRHVRPLSILGALTALPSAYGHVSSTMWVVQGYRNHLSYRIYNLRRSIKFKDMALFPEDSQVAQYYQINTARGTQWRSEKLKEIQASFAFLPGIFNKNRLDWKFDTTEVEPDLDVRRVQLKVSHFPVEFPSRRRGGPRSRNPDEEPPAKKAPRPEPEAFTIYIQAATSTADLKGKLAGLNQKLQEDLNGIEGNFQNQLSQLRTTLVVINVATLLAALLASCLLVHFGLRPLRRLSDAVSQVSEKDFQLHMESNKLPVELQPMTARLHQTFALLKRAFAREKQAAAEISHELRTPLAAMMATLEVGLRKDRSAPEYRELLQDCQEAGLQMTQLVERLLALARLDAGADNLRPREVDVAHLANQCASLVRPLADARGLSLSVQTNGAALIKADPDKLREVLTNLLHNAIEYNKPDGKIEIAVQRVNGHLEMQVSDTGIGIPADATHHIFERFYRQDSSRHSETAAMHAGIGLALVKGYVDMMGGHITVNSTLGEGSSFRIDLPVPENDEQD